MFNFIKKIKIQKFTHKLKSRKILKLKKTDIALKNQSKLLLAKFTKVNNISSDEYVEIARKRLSKKSYRAQLFLKIRKLYYAYFRIIYSQKLTRIYSTKYIFKRLRKFRKTIRSNKFIFNIFLCMLYYKKHNCSFLFPPLLFENLPTSLFLKTKLRYFYLNVFKPIFLNIFYIEFKKLIKNIYDYAPIYGKLALRHELKKNEFAYTKTAKYSFIKKIFSKHIRKYLLKQNRSVKYKVEKPAKTQIKKLIKFKNFLTLQKSSTVRLLLSPLPYFLFQCRQKREYKNRFYRTHLLSKFNLRFFFIYRNFTSGLFCKQKKTKRKKKRKIVFQLYTKAYNFGVKKLAHLLNFFDKAYGQKSFYKLSELYKVILPYLTLNKFFFIRKFFFFSKLTKLVVRFSSNIQIKQVIVFIHLFWFFYKLMTLVDLNFLIKNLNYKISLTFFFERMYIQFSYIYFTFLLNLRFYTYNTGVNSFYYLFPAKLKSNLWRIPQEYQNFFQWSNSAELHQILFEKNPILNFIFPLYQKFAKRVSTFVLSPSVFRFKYRTFKLNFIRKFKNFNVGYVRFDEKMNFEKRIFNLLRWYLRLLAWKLFYRKIYNKFGKKNRASTFDQVLEMKVRPLLPFKLKSFAKTRTLRFLIQFLRNLSQKTSNFTFIYTYKLQYFFSLIHKRRTLGNYSSYMIPVYKEINYRIRHLTFISTIRKTIQPSLKFKWNRTLPNFMLMYICKHN